MLSLTGDASASDGLLPEVRALMRQAHGDERDMVDDRGDEGRQGVCAPTPTPSRLAPQGCHVRSVMRSRPVPFVTLVVQEPTE